MGANHRFVKFEVANRAVFGDLHLADQGRARRIFSQCTESLTDPLRQHGNDLAMEVHRAAALCHQGCDVCKVLEVGSRVSHSNG